MDRRSWSIRIADAAHALDLLAHPEHGQEDPQQDAAQKEPWPDVSPLGLGLIFFGLDMALVHVRRGVFCQTGNSPSSIYVPACIRG
jgi:hypothetical protein